VLPRSLTGNGKREKHQDNRQGVDQQARQAITDKFLSNVGIHFHESNLQSFGV
jgi:hypothetical protein